MRLACIIAVALVAALMPMAVDAQATGNTFAGSNAVVNGAIVSGTLSAAQPTASSSVSGGTVSTPTSGFGSVAVQFPGSPSGITFVVDVSSDNSTWTQLGAITRVSGVPASLASDSPTAPSAYLVPVSGFAYARVRATVYGSTTASVTLTPTTSTFVPAQSGAASASVFAPAVGTLNVTSTSITGAQPAGSTVVEPMVQNGFIASSAVISVNGTSAQVSTSYEASDDPACATSTSAAWYLLDVTGANAASAGSGALAGASLTNPSVAYNVTRSGFLCLRIRLTSYTSGSVVGRITPSANPGAINPYFVSNAPVSTISASSGVYRLFGTAGTTLAVGTATAGPFLTVAGTLGFGLQATWGLNATATTAGTVTLEGSFDSTNWYTMPQTISVSASANSFTVGSIPAFPFYRFYSTVALTAVTSHIGGAY